jgi:hypothetical protein
LKRVYLDQKTLSAKQRERFWSKVLRIGDCWNWLEGTCEDGYGCFYANGIRYLAHVVAYTLKRGNVGDLLVCHTCDNPKCCKPDHLFLGTSQDNVVDSVNKGRHSSCTILGSDKIQSKLTEEDIPKIKSLRSQGLSYAYIGKKFGVDQALIYRICIGKSWKHA